MNLRRIPRKYVLIATHLLAFAAAVLVTFLYIKRGSRDRVGVGETFSSYVRLVPYQVAYTWGHREDAEAAVRFYVDNLDRTFIDTQGVQQKELFIAKSRLAILGKDPHVTIAGLCKEIDDSCRPETIDRWIELIRKGRKVPD